MSESTIEWTDKTWNPIRGCTRVSSGCVNCYAERTAARFAGPGQPYAGLVSVRSQVSGLRYEDPRGAGSWFEPRWTGKVAFVEDKLDEPLRWRKPARIFVNSMSDLFHEDLTNEQIAAVFSVMAAASHHTFQVLTKRPKRMREFFTWLENEWPKQAPGNEGHELDANVVHEYRRDVGCIPDWFVRNGEDFPAAWPLPNVWLGVSVENQKAADERIPLLLKTPAALRFLSVEPLLDAVDLTKALGGTLWMGGQRGCSGSHHGTGDVGCPRALHHHHDDRCETGLDWVIVGGESGPGARSCDQVWIRRVVDDCERVGVPVFVKQLGSNATMGGCERSSPTLNPRHPDVALFLSMKHKKGGDPAEWPADLRVRQFPKGGAL